MVIGCLCGLGVGMSLPDETTAGPLAGSDPEARIVRVLKQMYSQRDGMWNVSWEDGRLLRLLVEATGAKRVVEIGTSNGFSAIWFCLGLRSTGGHLITHEIDPYRVSLAKRNFKLAAVDELVTIVEGDAHETVGQLRGPIDILFLDADKQGYLDYLKKLLPLVRPGGLIIAHNTSDLGSQMQDYLKAVTTDPQLETVFVHKDAHGMSLTLKKRR